ncbi:hypothetical protein H0H81_004126 [Sphagnurus paluster]|uniref:Uncharacterized protein n=1 Tax=Sphagnurus paluster TaxID=117069 RepID=A0A9P7KI60_9AGAR|nr:hypothetical protein H0H81_004126 [Sphagnurus paluster]
MAGCTRIAPRYRTTTLYSPWKGMIPYIVVPVCDDLSNTGTAPTATTALITLDTLTSNSKPNMYAPFANSTIFGIMNWFWTGLLLKSLLEMSKLVNFLKSDAFQKEDLTDFDICKETAKFDQQMEGRPNSNEPSTSATPNNGWVETDVVIEVPDGEKHPDPTTIPRFSIPGLRHCSLLEIIRHTFSNPLCPPLHYTPFKTFWQKNDLSEPERVYDEIFSSDAMIEAHLDLQ